jgi:hypothetical protein
MEAFGACAIAALASTFKNIQTLTDALPPEP